VEHQQQAAVERRFRPPGREIEQLQRAFPAARIRSVENPAQHVGPETGTASGRQGSQHLVRVGQRRRPVRRAQQFGQHQVGHEHPQAVDLGDILVGEIAGVHGQAGPPTHSS
jgi:hypothetical protein